MAKCLLLRGWLVLLKTGACCGLPIFFEVTTNWRAGCQKLACPVRREGRPESSSLPLSVASASANQIAEPRASSPRCSLYDPDCASNPRLRYLTNDYFEQQCREPSNFATVRTVCGR